MDTVQATVLFSNNWFLREFVGPSGVLAVRFCFLSARIRINPLLSGRIRPLTSTPTRKTQQSQNTAATIIHH